MKKVAASPAHTTKKLAHATRVGKTLKAKGVTVGRFAKPVAPKTDLERTLVWLDFTKNAIVRSNKWCYLNAEVKKAADAFTGGLYLYTDEDRFGRYEFKLGQTIRGEERVWEQGADASVSRVLYLVAVINMEIPGPKYDVVIHKVLKDHFGCEIIKLNIDATEWVKFPYGVDPYTMALEAVQLETNKPEVGRDELLLTLSQAKSLKDAYYFLLQHDLYTLMAELCPRFGKTTWLLALFDILGFEALVVSSYVLSANESYRKEIKRFKQFLNLEFATSLAEHKANLAKGKKSIIEVSLHGKFDQWEKNYSWVKQVKNRLVAVDEADNGAHTKKQMRKVNVLRDKSKLLLMTGTAGDRAVGGHKIDKYIYKTYIQMLADKENPNPDFYDAAFSDKYPVAPNMATIPNIMFRQYNFSQLINKELEVNPSWHKAYQDPDKSYAWLKDVWQSFFGTSSNGMIMSANEVAAQTITGYMIFLPRTLRQSQTDHEKANHIDSPFTKAFKHLQVFAGSAHHLIEVTGNMTTGADAEKYVTDQIKAMKADPKTAHKIPVVVSTGHIGARSFSIPEINVVVLAFDNGSAAAVGQYSSRGSTRDDSNPNKVATVINIALDSTRDDAIAMAVLESAISDVDPNDPDNDNIVKAIKRVLRSLNYAAVTPDGEDLVPVDVDAYTEKILSSNSLNKVIGSSCNANAIIEDPALIHSLLEMTGQSISLGKAEAIAAKGKTFKIVTPGKRPKKELTDEQMSEREYVALVNKIREAIRLIADSSLPIARLASTETFSEAVVAINNDVELRETFESTYNADIDIISKLIEIEAVNVQLLDLSVHYAIKKLDSYSADDFAL